MKPILFSIMGCILILTVFISCFGQENKSGDIPMTDWHMTDLANGESEGATLSATDGGIVFHYNRSQHSALMQTVDLNAFGEIHFTVQSESDAVLILAVHDSQGATFHDLIHAPANVKIPVIASPSDFQINDDSPVKENALDPKLLGRGFILVDMAALKGESGENTLTITDAFVSKNSGSTEIVRGTGRPIDIEQKYSRLFLQQIRVNPQDNDDVTRIKHEYDQDLILIQNALNGRYASDLGHYEVTYNSDGSAAVQIYPSAASDGKSGKYTIDAEGDITVTEQDASTSAARSRFTRSRSGNLVKTTDWLLPNPTSVTANPDGSSRSCSHGNCSSQPPAKKMTYTTYVIKADGTGLRKMTETPMQQSHIRFAPHQPPGGYKHDGFYRIVFNRYDRDEDYGKGFSAEVMLADLNPATGQIQNQKVISVPGTLAAGNPVFSPDGKKVAFIAAIPKPFGGMDSVIFTYDLATGKFKETNTHGADPDWGTGGLTVVNKIVPDPATGAPVMRLFLSQDWNDSQGRFITNPVTSKNNPQPAKIPYGDTDPVISPDGTKVASDRHLPGWISDFHIVVHTIQTGEETFFPPPPDHSDGHMYAEILPSWSPDGSKITFGRTNIHIDTAAHKVYAFNQIVIADADGTNQRALPIPNGVEPFLPRFDPTGSYIVFSGVEK